MNKTEFDVINDLLLAHQQKRQVKDKTEIDATHRIEYAVSRNSKAHTNVLEQMKILESLEKMGFWKPVAKNPFIGMINNIIELKKELEEQANKYLVEKEYKGFTITKYYTKHGHYNGVWIELEKTMISDVPIYGNVGVGHCKRAIDKYLENKQAISSPEAEIHVFKTNMDYSGGVIFVHKNMLKEMLTNDSYSYIKSLEQFNDYIRKNIKKDEIFDEFFVIE